MWLLAALLAACTTLAVGAICSTARNLCAFRTGCGAALSNYMLMCADVQARSTTVCPEPCLHALIALTSTEEGKILMDCECEDEICRDSKKHLDVCREQVILGAANATSSCRLSELICISDAQCATALEYYHRHCRAMYRGRKCSYKCLNSIQILKKQEKAAALTSCHCDGYEEYNCTKMQRNLDMLCYHKRKKSHKKENEKDQNKSTEKTVITTLVSSVHSILPGRILLCFTMLCYWLIIT